jgi:hypothetical protein
MRMQQGINDEESRFHTTDLKHAQYTMSIITGLPFLRLKEQKVTGSIAVTSDLSTLRVF